MVRTVAIRGSLRILAIGVLTLTWVVVRVSLPGRTRAACRLAFQRLSAPLRARSTSFGGPASVYFLKPLVRPYTALRSPCRSLPVDNLWNACAQPCEIARSDGYFECNRLHGAP